VGLPAILLAAIGAYADTGAKGQTAAAKGSGRDRAGTELLAVQNGSRASFRRRSSAKQ